MSERQGQAWPGLVIKAAFHPYRRITAWYPPARRNPAGTIVILRPEPATDVRMITAAVRDIRARHLEVAVVLHARPAHAEEFTNAAGMLAHAGMRAVVFSRRLREPLFRILAHPVQLQHIANWWAPHLVRRGKGATRAVTAILTSAHAYSDWERLRIAERVPNTRQLRSMGAPPGRDLYRLGRGLYACSMLQHMREESIESVAAVLGYASGATFSNECVKLFGGRPNWIRDRSGLDWLMAAWCDRRGLRAR